MSKFFANGTEGRAWMALWCDRCENDHEMHSDTGTGCVYLSYSLADMEEELDGIWFDESEKYGFTFPPAIRCTKFKGCAACGDGNVALDEHGYPTEVRQQEWARPAGDTGPAVLFTDRLLSGPKGLKG